MRREQGQREELPLLHEIMLDGVVGNLGVGFHPELLENARPHRTNTAYADRKFL